MAPPTRIRSISHLQGLLCGRDKTPGAVQLLEIPNPQGVKLGLYALVACFRIEFHAAKLLFRQLASDPSSLYPPEL